MAPVLATDGFGKSVQDPDPRSYFIKALSLIESVSPPRRIKESTASLTAQAPCLGTSFMRLTPGEKIPVLLL